MFTKTSDLVAFDLETFRFSDRQRSPKVICGGLDCELNGFEAFSRDALKPRLIELLKNDQTIILHNASYDIGCLLATFPDLTEEIYAKLDRDQIYCSFTAARLLGIAIGHKSMDKLKNYYSLEGCLKRYEIAELVKDKEIQLSYDQVDGLEPDKWPKKYYDYLVDDVIYLRRLVVEQLQRADQLQYRRFKRNVFNETSMAVPFMRMTNRGVLASSKIIQIYDGMKAEYDRCKIAAIEDGFIDAKKGSVVKKRVQAAIFEELGDEAPRTEKTGTIQTGKDVIADCKSPKLKSIQRYQKMGKYISTFVKPIKNGVYGSIHPGFLPLGAATGRSSSHHPNFQNQPNDLGIRESIIARPGFVLVACDYDSLELRTLAQACQTITGRSVLAEWYNKDPDFDPHSLLATKLCHLSYEEFLKRKKEPEYKALRDLAKATNFTFPGGGGPGSLVRQAWAKDRLAIPFEKAEFLKKTFVEQWGLKPYFSHVGDITNKYDPIYQIKSGRMRGNIQYPAACNTYFQGLGADVSKTAAVKVDRASYLASLKSPLFGSYPVLFVHDELVVEVPEENAGACAAEIKRLMEEAQKEWCPDVAPGATPAISRNWTKAAQTIIVEGEYRLWEPKKNV